MEDKSPITPADPVGEIIRRATTVGAFWSSIDRLAPPEVKNDPAWSEYAKNMVAVGHYYTDVGRFIMDRQEALRALIRRTGASYQAITAALALALQEATGSRSGPFLRRVDPDALFALIEKRLRTTVKRGKDFDALFNDDEPSIVDDLLTKPVDAVAASPAGLIPQTIMEAVARLERGRRSLLALNDRRSSHGTKWEITIPEDAALIVRTNSKGERVALGVKDVRKFEGNKLGNVKKIARYILTKAGKNMQEGRLATDDIYVDAEELVYYGMYERKADARRGILTAVDVFDGNFGIYGTYFDKKTGKPRDIWAPFLSFRDKAFDGDSLLIKLNTAINWTGICKEFSFFPTAYYRLKSSRAADLYDKIYELARMQGDALAGEKAPGVYFVKLDPTVREWLDIPDPATYSGKDPKKAIKAPVFEALAEIEKHGAGEKLTLETPDGRPLDPDLPVREWIKGRLRVDLRGTPAWDPLLGVLDENKEVQKNAARDRKKEERKEPRSKDRRAKKTEDALAKIAREELAKEARAK